MLRTGRGFQVYSDPGDPASQFVTMRPVESSPASAAGFERLSSWLEMCRASHRKCCEMATSARRSEMAPARLIRIVDLAREGHFLRLVSTDGLETLPEFVALSYCWGGDQALESVRATIASLQRDLPFAQLAPILGSQKDLPLASMTPACMTVVMLLAFGSHTFTLVCSGISSETESSLAPRPFKGRRGPGHRSTAGSRTQVSHGTNGRLRTSHWTYLPSREN